MAAVVIGALVAKVLGAVIEYGLRLIPACVGNTQRSVTIVSRVRGVLWMRRWRCRRRREVGLNVCAVCGDEGDGWRWVVSGETWR